MRDRGVDVLKGIGIVAVVLGHVVGNDAAGRFVFLWHMPLFFLVSGFLAAPPVAWPRYAAGRTRALLGPYFAFLVVLSLPFVAVAAYRAGAPGVVAYVLRALHGGHRLGGWFGPFWFITCLYLTQLAGAALIRRLDVPALLALAGVLAAAALTLSARAPALYLPWAAEVALMALPLYLLGWAGRRAVADPPAGAAWLAGAAGVALYAAGWAEPMDMKQHRYGTPGVSLMAAVAIVVALFHLARRIAPTSLAAPWAYFGRTSMTVMYVHQPVQLFLLLYLGVQNAGVRMAAALLASVAVHEALRRHPWGRTVFLGLPPLPKPAPAPAAPTAAADDVSRPTVVS